MARLTRLQLRAIFAKLGKVKSEIIKARGPTVSMRSGISHVEMDHIFSPAVANHYIQRLPQKHRDLSALPDATRVKVWNDWIEDSPVWGTTTMGLYYPDGREIHITRSLDFALRTQGYFETAKFVPRATRVTPRYDMPGRREAVRWGTVMARNAKLGVARSFYHEYAHSILHGYKLKFGEPHPLRWVRIARTKEWGQLADVGEHLTPLRQIEESFSDAYASYATSKKMRAQLKRQSPRSYKYMKRFFETGELG